MVATPVTSVVPVTVSFTPVGPVIVAVTEALDTRAEPFFTVTDNVAVRPFPVLGTTAVAVAERVTAAAAMVAEPLALVLKRLLPSVAETENACDPLAAAGDVNASVVVTLAPGASDAAEAGLNDADQPLGVAAANV